MGWAKLGCDTLGWPIGDGWAIGDGGALARLGAELREPDWAEADEIATPTNRRTVVIGRKIIADAPGEY